MRHIPRSPLYFTENLKCDDFFKKYIKYVTKTKRHNFLNLLDISYEKV